MAKLNTKNMTPAELKAAKKELAASHKALLGSAKLNAKSVADATKAKNEAVATYAKTLAAAQKAHDVAVKASHKSSDAVVKGLTKEAAKLTVQIDAHVTKIAQIDAALAAPVAQGAEA